MQNQTVKLFSVLLTGAALGWLLGSRGPADGPARVQAGVAGGGSAPEVVAFTADAVNGGQVLYLIDPKQKVVSLYEFDTKKAKLKLAAVRHYEADQQLSEFNNEPPTVAEIEKLVRQR